MSSEITSQLLILLILILVGLAGQRTRLLDEAVGTKLSLFITNVTMPALYVSTFMRRFTVEGLQKGAYMLLVSLFYYLLAFAVGILFVRLFSVPVRCEGVYRFMLIFSNAAFMAYPVITAIFPHAAEDALFLAVFFNIPFNALAFTLGVWLLRRGSGKPVSWRMLLLPGSVSAFIGLFVFFISPLFPDAVYSVLYEGTLYKALKMLGDTTIPLSMIVIGTVLAKVNVRDVFLNGRIYVMSAVRLLLLPAAVYAFTLLLPMDDLARGVCTVITGMPCAVFAVILSKEYGGDERTASIGVFVSTLLSLATIPLLCTLLTAGG